MPFFSVPSNNSFKKYLIFDDTVPSDNFLFDGTAMSYNFLFGGTLPSNNLCHNIEEKRFEKAKKGLVTFSNKANLCKFNIFCKLWKGL